MGKKSSMYAGRDPQLTGSPIWEIRGPPQVEEFIPLA